MASTLARVARALAISTVAQQSAWREHHAERVRRWQALAPEDPATRAVWAALAPAELRIDQVHVEASFEARSRTSAGAELRVLWPVASSADRSRERMQSRVHLSIEATPSRRTRDE